MSEPVDKFNILAQNVPWRVGSKVGRTIYAITSSNHDDHPLIGVMDTSELAIGVCMAHNQWIRQ